MEISRDELIQKLAEAEAEVLSPGDILNILISGCIGYDNKDNDELEADAKLYLLEDYEVVD